MKPRLLVMLVLFSVLPFIQACLITNRDIESLKEQVRLDQKNVAALQKKVEEHSIRMEGIENSLQMIESRVDDNTERIEDMKAGMVSEVLPAESVPTPVTVEPSVQPGEMEAYAPRPFTTGEDLYNSAYGHFENGEFGQAILEFEEYVANYGKSELADNAQYWIGECYYAQKDFRQAIREFDKVENNFPDGNKVPAAKLKKGLAYHEMGNPNEAVREMKELISDFPDSEEVFLAEEKLKSWK